MSGTLWQLEYSDHDGHIIQERREVVWAWGGELIHYTEEFGTSVMDMLVSEPDDETWAKALHLAYDLQLEAPGQVTVG